MYIKNILEPLSILTINKNVIDLWSYTCFVFYICIVYGIIYGILYLQYTEWC